jgi:cytochrome P450
MLLGQNPQWQETLREECRALDKPYLEYEDLHSLPNLDNALMESLRLYPSVSMMARRTIRDSEIGGYFVPANTVLIMPPAFNHRMEAWWDDPLKFDPDRFGPQRQEHKRHSFSFVPFGGGIHKCIGMHFAQMNAKCFMYQFLSRYRFETPQGYQPKMQTVPMPRPADLLPLRLSRLAQTSSGLS